MFEAFPMELRREVSSVISMISKSTYGNIRTGATDDGCAYTLLDGQDIVFPYRIYYRDEINGQLLTFEQEMIYHCLFSRSCDGFVREKHIKEILSEDYPDWTLPYILKVSDEYVIEILEVIYDLLKGRDNDKMQVFCEMNVGSFLCSHDRMISYWNEYYRNRIFSYKDYIGKKLFSECFGYTRSMEKERSRYK